MLLEKGQSWSTCEHGHVVPSPLESHGMDLAEELRDSVDRECHGPAMNSDV